MEFLWAPWRMQYIEIAKNGKDRENGCIFCIKAAEKNDKKNLIVAREKRSFVIMNLFPYNNGHVMIVPFRHTGKFEELEDVEMLELMQIQQKMLRVLDRTMKPQGYNVGINLGRTAGAGIEDHLHIHLVPRWSGDTNFMPVVGQTKVTSEDLQVTWGKLAKGYESINYARGA